MRNFVPDAPFLQSPSHWLTDCLPNGQCKFHLPRGQRNGLIAGEAFTASSKQRLTFILGCLQGLCKRQELFCRTSAWQGGGERCQPCRLQKALTRKCQRWLQNAYVYSATHSDIHQSKSFCFGAVFLRIAWGYVSSGSPFVSMCSRKKSQDEHGLALNL